MDGDKTGLFSGQLYSKKHKDSSTLVTQSPQKGSKYPSSGEIDLMKYADENEYKIALFHERSVAAREDVIGLLVISGISKK